MSSSLTLLGLLEREPSYGYDLKRDYDRLFGREKPLPSGQVYATLARLDRDRLIEAHGTESGGGPERKRYAVTPDGRIALLDWLRQPEPPAPLSQTTIFVKTVLALLLGKDAGRYLDDQRAAHLERMRQLTRVPRQSDLAEALLVDHAIFHLEADLRWIELTTARLAALAAEITR